MLKIELARADPSEARVSASFTNRCVNYLRHFITTNYLGIKVYSQKPSLRSGLLVPIFNMIFEFSAVFTCYSTYYKPIAKKVG